MRTFPHPFVSIGASRRRWAWSWGALMLLAGCDGWGGTSDPVGSIEVTSATQEVVAGEALLIEATLYGVDGLALAAAPVRFRTESGVVESAVERSNPEGRIRALWAPDPVVGEHTLTIEGTGLSLDIVSAVRAATPRRVHAVSGDGQHARLQAALPLPFTIEVHDVYGNPTTEVPVDFLIVGGEGRLLNGTAVTDAEGRASTTLVLGDTPGETLVRASTPGASTYTFTGTATVVASPMRPGAGFEIFAQGTSLLPASVDAALREATARWQRVILGDLLDADVNVPAGLCGVNHPAVSGTVDDLIVFVEVAHFDGPGGSLASAGPCMLRRGSRLPMLGVVRLDVEDVDRLAAAGELAGVIVHEIGHVLGLGPLWAGLGQLSGAGTSDPVHTGAHATAEYRASGGTGGVPLENSGTAATREVHWRESMLGAEIMTGWIDHDTGNPLSRVTVGAIEDLGYVVDYSAADAFATSSAKTGQSKSGFAIVEEPAPPPRFSRY